MQVVVVIVVDVRPPPRCETHVLNWHQSLVVYGSECCETFVRYLHEFLNVSKPLRTMLSGRLTEN